MALPFRKDADETATFEVDWSDMLDLGGSPSDTLSTVTWSLPSESPAGITKASQSNTVSKAYITVSGGEAGSAYRVNCSVATTGGDTWERAIIIQINEEDAELLDVDFVVEDGTPLSTSNSYCSVKYADEYHLKRGNSAWINATRGDREAALIKGTFYLVSKYRMRWKGIRVQRTQALDWPRAGVITEDFYDPTTDPRPALFPKLAYEIPETEIPTEVKDAACEVALRVIQGTDIFPDTSGGGAIKKVVAGSVSVEYQNGSAGTGVVSTFDMPHVYGIVRALLRKGRDIGRG